MIINSLEQNHGPEHPSSAKQAETWRRDEVGRWIEQFICSFSDFFQCLPNTLCICGHSTDPKELLCSSEKKIINEFKKKNPNPSEKDFDLLELAFVPNWGDNWMHQNAPQKGLQLHFCSVSYDSTGDAPWSITSPWTCWDPVTDLGNVRATCLVTFLAMFRISCSS